MKITYIISDIDKAVFFEHTLIGLRNNCHDVQVILINSENGVLSAFLNEMQFQVHHVKSGRIHQSVPAIRIVKRILKEFRPDLVHCHLSHANWIGLWAAKMAKVKHRLFTRHSGLPLTVSKKEQVIDYIQNRLATRIVSITENITELLIRQGVNKSNISLLHHGFILDEFEPDEIEIKRIRNQYSLPHFKPVVGVVARWMEWKGIHYIIRAFGQLRIDQPNAHLFLFGYSKTADYAKELSEELHQLPADSYTIAAFENNVYQLYQLFDLYVHTPVNAHCEAFGQTYIEALAAGIPSVFTLSGVAREFIKNEENALVVEFRNSEAIYEAMKRILRDEQLKQTLIESGKQSIRQFDFSFYLKNLISLYQECILIE